MPAAFSNASASSMMGDKFASNDRREWERDLRDFNNKVKIFIRKIDKLPKTYFRNRFCHDCLGL